MKKFVLVSLIFAIFSCSFPATKEGMTFTNPHSSNTIGNKIYVKKVVDHSETSFLRISKISAEDFTAALKDSLLSSKVFLNTSKKWDEDWALEAEIINVRYPYFVVEFDIDVGTEISYTLYKRGKKVFDTVIVAEDTGRLGDTFFGAKRMRIAHEKSAKSNIKKFIKELEKANL